MDPPLTYYDILNQLVELKCCLMLCAYNKSYVKSLVKIHFKDLRTQTATKSNFTFL